MAGCAPTAPGSCSGTKWGQTDLRRNRGYEYYWRRRDQTGRRALWRIESCTKSGMCLPDWGNLYDWLGTGLAFSKKIKTCAALGDGLGS